MTMSKNIGKIYVLDATSRKRYKVTVGLQPDNSSMTRVTPIALLAELEHLFDLTDLSLYLNGSPVAPDIPLPAHAKLVALPVEKNSTFSSTELRHVDGGHSNLAYHRLNIKKNPYSNDTCVEPLSDKSGGGGVLTSLGNDASLSEGDKIDLVVGHNHGTAFEETSSAPPLVPQQPTPLDSYRINETTANPPVPHTVSLKSSEFALPHCPQQRAQDHERRQVAFQKSLLLTRTLLESTNAELHSARRMCSEAEVRLAASTLRASAAEAEDTAAGKRLEERTDTLRHRLAALSQFSSATLADEAARHVSLARDVVAAVVREQRAALRLNELTDMNVQMERQLCELEERQRKLRRVVEDRKGAVRVIVRLRPICRGESVCDGQGGGCSMHAESDISVNEAKGMVRVTARDFGQRAFEFFAVYGPQMPATTAAEKEDEEEKENRPSDDYSSKMRSSSSCCDRQIYQPHQQQRQIFDEQVQPLLELCSDGTNVTVLAYGPTGSGKTYTIIGLDATQHSKDISYDKVEGLLPRSLRWLVRRMGSEIHDEPRVVSLRLSIVELYMDRVFDLLAKTSTRPDGSMDRSSRERQYKEENETQVNIVDVEETMRILRETIARRQTHKTLRNATSSRSHLFITFRMEWLCESPNHTSTKTSKLKFCDLAGSERVSESQVSGDRLREAQHINKSLAAIGDVLHALTTAPASSTTPLHVPYRNNKVTQMLQDSLGGESKTLLVTCISPQTPGVWNASEAISTLKFASRAKVVYKLQKNKVR